MLTQHYLNNWDKYDTIPSVAGLARSLKVGTRVIYSWAENHEEFSDLKQQLLDEQHRILLNSGLSGKFNSTITKVILTKHGYSDKLDNTHSSPDGSMSPNRELSEDELKKELESRGLPVDIFDK